MAIALTGTEPAAPIWGETRRASDVGRKGKGRPFVWAKCPQCSKGKWVRKDSVKPDGVTSKTVCDECNFGFTLTRTEGGSSQPKRLVRFCPKCRQNKSVADFYTSKRTKNFPKGYCKPCNLGTARRAYWKNRDRILAREKEQRQEYRKKIIEAYGGACSCCGESHHEFLTIDHVGGGGGEHRKEAGGTRGVFKEIVASGFPKDRYRLLCYNCNCAIGAYGYCPHQKTAGGDPS